MPPNTSKIDGSAGFDFERKAERRRLAVAADIERESLVLSTAQLIAEWITSHPTKSAEELAAGVLNGEWSIEP